MRYANHMSVVALRLRRVTEALQPFPIHSPKSLRWRSWWLGFVGRILPNRSFWHVMQMPLLVMCPAQKPHRKWVIIVIVVGFRSYVSTNFTRSSYNLTSLYGMIDLLVCTNLYPVSFLPCCRTSSVGPTSFLLVCWQRCVSFSVVCGHTHFTFSNPAVRVLRMFRETV